MTFEEANEKVKSLFDYQEYCEGYEAFNPDFYMPLCYECTRKEYCAMSEDIHMISRCNFFTTISNDIKASEDSVPSGWNSKKPRILNSLSN